MKMKQNELEIKTKHEDRIEVLLEKMESAFHEVRKPLYKELITELILYKEKYGRGYLPRQARGEK